MANNFESLKLLIAVLPLVALTGGACDQISGGTSDTAGNRFELKQDSQGRVIRLNKVTGEMVIVEGTRVVPLKDSKVTHTESDSRGRGLGTPASTALAEAPQQSMSKPLPSDSRTASDMQAENVIITTKQTVPVFASADRKGRPLVLAAQGSQFRVTGSDSVTYRIEFTDSQIGHRVGYVEKRFTQVSNTSLLQPVDVSIPDAQPNRPTKPSSLEPIDVSVPEARTNHAAPIDVSISAAPTPLGNGRAPASESVTARSSQIETLHGYIEWQRDGYVIADGQRVHWNANTVLQPSRTIIRNVPLGYEFTAVGSRLNDGSLLATKISVKPNGTAAFERQTQQTFDSVEQQWEREGLAFDVSKSGRHLIGRVTESGPDVARIQAIVNRLVPPSRAGAPLRVRIIETKEWNASAMPNGAIWVNRGLLDDVSNDELAIVLGHELAHYTHEHQRRSARNSALVQMTAAFASAGLQQISSPGKYAAARLGAGLALDAWQSGYSRSLEDQADRVGLRYAFEAGFDVTQGPRLWNGVRERNGQPDKISNFFLGDHSRPSDRARNLEREISFNYSQR